MALREVLDLNPLERKGGGRAPDCCGMVVIGPLVDHVGLGPVCLPQRALQAVGEVS